MKSISNSSAAIILLVIMCMSLTSCEAVAGIFKAGVWVGVLVVVAVIGLLIMLLRRSGNK